MKLQHKVLASVLLAASVSANAQDTWLHIYYPNDADYKAFDMKDVFDITFDQTNGTMDVNEENDYTRIYGSKIDWFNFGPNVGSLRIVTDEPYYTEVLSKTEYLDATLYFEGRGHQDDYEMPVQIRGRGNSTWSYPKKPYRLKFEEKQRLLLPKKAKSYVLLANYIDGSMMRNAAAFMFGEVIDMPYIHHAVPVDVYFNDIYKGAYTLTEKVGFNNGSVNIKAADEPNSIMLELDNNNVTRDRFTNKYIFTDEAYYFVSAPYNAAWDFCFPVKIKDPDAPDEHDDWIDKWKADFDELMNAVNRGKEDEIFELCDLESLVRYVMVFNFCCNQELDHPKSVYMYKTEGGKWYFGPCWDFDWAFGYRPTYYEGSEYGIDLGGESYENPLLGLNSSDAYSGIDGQSGYFFYILCNNTTFMDKFEEIWQDFLDNGQETFWANFDAYVESLRPSANLQAQDGKYTVYRKFDNNVETLRTWIENRINFITTDPNHGLWKDGVFEEYM